MRYCISKLIQQTKFSCLEELKCDIIEYLMIGNLQNTVRSAIVIIPSDLAKELYKKVMAANVNDFSFGLYHGTDDTDVIRLLHNNQYVILTFDGDGLVFVERGQIYCEIGTLENELVYLHNSLYHRWENLLKDNSASVLVWTVEE